MRSSLDVPQSAKAPTWLTLLILRCANWPTVAYGYSLVALTSNLLVNLDELDQIKLKALDYEHKASNQGSAYFIVPIKRAAWRKNPSLLHYWTLSSWGISISVAKNEWRMLEDPSPSFTHPSLRFLPKNQQDRWPSEGVKDFFAFIKKIEFSSSRLISNRVSTFKKEADALCPYFVLNALYFEL